MCSHRICDESTYHIQSGRTALALHGRHSLAALAVGGQRALLPARHRSGHVLACVRPARSVSAIVALVAPVGLQLPVPHRLGAPATAPAALSRFAPRPGERSLSLAVASSWDPEKARPACSPGAPAKNRRHRADTCAARQVSARFRQCPLPDSTLSARSIRCRTPLQRLRGMLSLIPTVANCRDRHGFMRALPVEIDWLPTVVVG